MIFDLDIYQRDSSSSCLDQVQRSRSQVKVQVTVNVYTVGVIWRMT